MPTKKQLYQRWETEFGFRAKDDPMYVEPTKTNNMNKIEEIAQCVINNRYARNELTKVSDFELYHGLIDKIKLLSQSNPSEFGLVKQEERDNPLINAARGRDACGINHDELNLAHEEELKELKQQADKLTEENNKMKELLKSDSVFRLLRYGFKSPSLIGLDDCEDNCHVELYNISADLINKP
jgi:hypothetical protein